MTIASPDLILASASPRRLELLARLGLVPALVDPADIDETPRRGELPATYAARMATEKAAVVAARHPGRVTLAADTVVALGRRILPKAETGEQVTECLARLAGRRHRVLSAVTVVDADGVARGRLSTSIVAFGPVTAVQGQAYADTGEGVGKAGGYAIQGRAEAFIRFLGGSHSGVVGLPLFETRGLLIAAGLL